MLPHIDSEEKRCLDHLKDRAHVSSLSSVRNPAALRSWLINITHVLSAKLCQGRHNNILLLLISLRQSDLDAINQVLDAP